MVYTKSREEWEDGPEGGTVLRASDLNMEAGVYGWVSN